MSQPHRSLRSLNLQARYRSNSHNLAQDFYRPVLSAAKSYSRAVGYFTSSSLELLAEGLQTFYEAGGRMRIVASPQLTELDIEDIRRGYEVRRVMERAVSRTIEQFPEDQLFHELGTLGRLIAEGRIDMQIAFLHRQDGVGIYHEKIGYFEDDPGNIVAISGSANETLLGLDVNFERIDVFCSWLPGDDARASGIAREFDELWDNETAGLTIVPFPQVAMEKLQAISLKAEKIPVRTTRAAQRQEVLAMPAGFELRDYQQAAVNAWLANHGRGILRMATGTGKTKTALAAAVQVARASREAEQALGLLIVAPFTHLVDQWLEELRQFGVTAIPVYEDSAKWGDQLIDQLAAARAGRRSLVAMVATNASLALPKFQGLIASPGIRIMFIGDEAHNLGSSRFLRMLPTSATYRLALSATPERWFDDDGTQALIDYFGPIVYELGLGEAIAKGALSRYNYFPRLVTLTTDEQAMYAEVSAKIATILMNRDDMPEEDDGPLGALLRKRAAILGHAAGKVPAFASDAAGRLDQWWQLVYCAEGSQPLTDGGYAQDRQTEIVLRTLGLDLGVSAHPYTSQESRRERQRILSRFASGDDLRFLVAMRCLDEGVDIPDARIAYLLASSSNPRQFIQRRGRILRKAPGKHSADIYDYLAVPASGADGVTDLERRLMRRELQRAAEFAKLADNFDYALNVLRPLKQRYGLEEL